MSVFQDKRVHCRLLFPLLVEEDSILTEWAGLHSVSIVHLGIIALTRGECVCVTYDFPL